MPRPAVSGLEQLSIHDLTVLYDAVALAADAFIGVMGQPRTEGAAFDAVEDELERCNGLTAEIVEEMKARRPVEKRDAALRLRLITRHYIDAFDCPLDLIRFATDFEGGKTL